MNKLSKEKFIFNLLCKGDVSSTPNTTGDILTFIRRKKDPENDMINKDYILPPVHRLAVKFFLKELNSFLDDHRSSYYDSMLSGIIYGLLGGGNTEIFDTEEREYLDLNSKNKNHWLYHYHIYDMTTWWLSKPKVTDKTLQRMYEILVDYNWQKNFENRGISLKNPSWLKGGTENEV